MDDKTFQLLKDMGGAAKDAITQLSQSLGVASEHVYGVLIRQQVVQGITTLLVIALIACLWIFAAKKYIKHVLLPTSTYIGEVDYIKIDNDGLSVGLGIILGVWALIMIVAIATDGADAIGKLINPEYYAIQNIFSLIKGAVGK